MFAVIGLIVFDLRILLGFFSFNYSVECLREGFFEQDLVIVVEDTRIYAYSTVSVVKLPTWLRTTWTCFSYSALAAQDVNVS
jgi:hypothetical protein